MTAAQAPARIGDDVAKLRARLEAAADSKRKAAIMAAWEAGEITAEEAEEWIVLAGLEAA